MYLGDINSNLPHGTGLHYRHGPLEVLQSDRHCPHELLVRWWLMGTSQCSPQCVQTCTDKVYIS